MKTELLARQLIKIRLCRRETATCCFFQCTSRKKSMKKGIYVTEWEKRSRFQHTTLSRGTAEGRSLILLRLCSCTDYSRMNVWVWMEKNPRTFSAQGCGRTLPGLVINFFVNFIQTGLLLMKKFCVSVKYNILL